ncbi:hypothetical protein GGX14DRAFT_579992 [Mycena pura]|uniref:Zn(2)-C6 fungal-type domain-containing protein n=1 Tax=Mycena pura TaxID=153505 RepID=A0AAD6Y3S6_9AGAR|nr:hypothetical protein GGX14DRAFT_579992 [Mycena pura]
MSDSDSLFTTTKRVLVACTNCRQRKAKCLTDSQDRPCMRCQRHQLKCQYLSTAEYPSPPTQSTGGGRSKESQRPPPMPLPPGSTSDIILADPYAAYNTNSQAGTPWPQHPPTGPPSAGPGPAGGPGAQYRPPGHRNYTYPAPHVPAEAQTLPNISQRAKQHVPHPPNMPPNYPAMYPSAPPQYPSPSAHPNYYGQAWPNQYP